LENYNQLTDQDFPLRMNIHFCLKEDLKKEIISLNQALVDVGSEIDFGKDHIPHITILMGTIASLSDYQYIVNAITKTASEISPQAISLFNPYCLIPQKKFVFMDIAPINRLKDIKREFLKAIKGHIKLDYYGRPQSHVHLTLGFIEIMSKDIENLIQKMNLINTQSVVSQVGISVVSDKGTCLQETFTVDLLIKK